MKYKEKKILLWGGIVIILNCFFLLTLKCNIDALENRTSIIETHIKNIEDLIYDDEEGKIETIEQE